ncbi:MAG: class I SAM-dependent methyltransferase [Chloroflexota bacterium]|nr:class I SAM-dependent methyltransferase [Chloroflexota bacterium]
MDDPLNWSADDQEQALRAIAPWYDLDFGPLTDDVEMLQGLAVAGQRVLELGAGSGRIAAPLAQMGCEVTAVDSSEAMLAVGEPRLKQAGVNVVSADMRCLHLGAEFDLLVIGLSTFQHLLRRQDQLATLGAARRHLDAGGRLLIDWTAPRPDDIDPSPPFMQLEWLRRSDSGEMVTKSAGQELAQNRTCGDALDRALSVAWITYQYDAVDEVGRLRRTLARFPLRVNLTVGEMAGLLAQSGLRPIDWFGSWDLAPAGDGDRLIVLAKAAS